VHQKELKKREILKTELTLLEKVLQKELKIKEEILSAPNQAEIILPEETIEDLKIIKKIVLNTVK
jgi:hypothetical protein